MIPIHSLLSRIRWDPGYARARWEIAYLDRTRMGLVRLPLEAIETEPGAGFAFDVIDEEGVTHSIPYHRVRQVWRDGKLFWSRLAPRKQASAMEKQRVPSQRRAPRLRPAASRR